MKQPTLPTFLTNRSRSTMIEVKLTFATVADMLAHFACTTQPALTNSGPTSATVTADKQAAAIESAKNGTAGKGATKPAKDKAEVKNPETPLDALKTAVTDEKAAEPTKPARTYETSGLADKIAKGATKDKAAVVALLTKHKAINGEGKPNGKALPVDAFDAFEADIDALLAPAEDLG
jgi:predicted deacylase